MPELTASDRVVKALWFGLMTLITGLLVWTGAHAESHMVIRAALGLILGISIAIGSIVATMMVLSTIFGWEQSPTTLAGISTVVLWVFAIVAIETMLAWHLLDRSEDIAKTIFLSVTYCLTFAVGIGGAILFYAAYWPWNIEPEETNRITARLKRAVAVFLALLLLALLIWIDWDLFASIVVYW